MNWWTLLLNITHHVPSRFKLINFKQVSPCHLPHKYTEHCDLVSILSHPTITCDICWLACHSCMLLRTINLIVWLHVSHIYQFLFWLYLTCNIISLKSAFLVQKLKNHLLTQTCLSSVGKISRRVCLVHYPEPGELEKTRFSLSSQRTEGGMYITSCWFFEILLKLHIFDPVNFQ